MTASSQRVPGDSSAMHCTLVLTSELKSMVENNKCPEVSSLFPTPENDIFWMLGQGESTSLIYASERSDNVLVFQPDDSKIQNAVKQQLEEEAADNSATPSSSSTTGSYLDAPLGGKWQFLSEEGTVLAELARPDVGLDFLLPPENAVWNLCGETVHLQLPCVVGEQPIHIENGSEGSPCTLLGECDEGLQCVELTMYQKECVKEEEITEDLKIVKGPQPAAPYTNCFFAPEDQKCAVEGFSCYRNSQWDDYAQCRPTGDCPRTPTRTAVKYSEMMKEGNGSVGSLSSMDLRRRMQAVEANPETFTPLHSRGSSLQSVVRKLYSLDSFKSFQENRRRLNAEFDRPGTERRRLMECLKTVHGGNGDEPQLDVASAPDNMRREPIMSSGANPHVRVNSQGRTEMECGGDWFDFAEVDDHETELPEIDLKNLNEEAIDPVDFYFDGEDELDDDGDIDIGFSYGWMCDEPLGATTQSNENRKSLTAARTELEDAGLNADRALGSLAILDSFQSQNSLLPPTPTVAPPPTEKKRYSGTYKCSKNIPSYSAAPGVTLSPKIVCAPKVGLGPGVDVGVKVYISPELSAAPGFHGGFTLYMAPYLRLSVTHSNAVRVYSAPILRLAPTSTNGVSLNFAPVVTAIPTSSNGASLTMAPTLIIPDIFQDWVFRRTPLPVGKTREIAARVDDTVVIQKKEGVPDIDSFVDFVYEDVLPVREIESTLEQDLDLPTLPDGVEKVGIKKQQKLGDYYSISTSVSVRCPRYDLNYDRPNDRHVKVYYIEPRDGRRGGLSSECVFPYPSDVIRDIPHLPPSAIYGIRALESIESLLPPELRIAASFLLRTIEVIGEGNIPNFAKTFADYAEMHVPGGHATVFEHLRDSPLSKGFENLFGWDSDRRMLQGNMTAQGGPRFSPMTFSKAVKLAKDLTPAASLAGLPTLFPKDSKTWQKAEAQASEIAHRAFKFIKETTEMGAGSMLKGASSSSFDNLAFDFDNVLRGMEKNENAPFLG
uniref:Uncharacterized protein n=1 Tax=Chromera velia CCMP2878 TaxID=1169474 RepID=A0A0G4I589_9ALVE|eukprot:Cvel_11121.t1-p1 / transcript=Cvel_11121.t1 / gene=Cvel_11121 / organism=Chromera_velia_CCMP2878 / gene_product=hypothetical protein / transcript_product=hypothetical protein / location=Cvel_scaffold689:3057-8038(-) / protein_length=999 / sequence_SO=supercontig / SO=protein_coding / is_pseudo=false